MANGTDAEEYLLEDGEGLIDVRGDDFDSGLLVGGAPVSFYWSDCEGSIAQYLVRSRDTAGLSERLRALRQVAGGGLDPRTPLAPQVRSLLVLFPSGRYRLSYTPANPWDVIDYDTRFSYAADRDCFYPVIEGLITTRPADTLRRERIDFFRQRIAAGERPVVFAAGVPDRYCAFVLDGHHKLQAYRQLQLPPAVLLIVKEATDPIALADGLLLLGAATRYREDYRRVKQAYGGIVTEADWLDCTVPWQLAHYMHTRASNRKKRLLACACCRQEWRRLGKPGQRAVEEAERFADGLTSEAELAAACRAAEAAGGRVALRPPAPRHIAADTCRPQVEGTPLFPAEEGRMISLMRDIFGNPFRPVQLESSWLTSNVVGLARAAHEERVLPAGTLEPDRLAILADALEDAGCTNADILSHLRGPGPHVRGCWVVDLLLQKG
jgi:hypothetical protein